MIHPRHAQDKMHHYKQDWLDKLKKEPDSCWKNPWLIHLYPNTACYGGLSKLEFLFAAAYMAYLGYVMICQGSFDVFLDAAVAATTITMEKMGIF